MQTLRLFCDVARHLSFSRAAAENGITQSAASQRIDKLESKLGVTLIDRSVRPLALTPAGELFFREGREILERYERLEREISGMRPALDGRVAVFSIYSAGIDLLNTIQSRFEAQHPGVEVTVTYLQPEAVYDGVRGEQCDFGIVSYPRTWREVGVIPLRDEPMAVVVAPGHTLAVKHSNGHRRKLQAHELDGLDMAAFEPELPVARRIRKYLRDAGAQPTVTSVFDNIDTVKAAVAVTNQFAILPKRTAMRDVKAGSLAVIELEPPLARPIGIIYRKRRSSGGGGGGVFTPSAQAFADYLIQHAGPNVDLAAQVGGAQEGVLPPQQLVGGAS
jgi:DNA-binding transcriptional LysR family regulator